MVFTDPEIAWAGLTEAEAEKQGRKVEVASSRGRASGRAIAIDRVDGMTKLIIDPETERILGVGIVGSGAGELIAEGVLAIEMGATASDLKLTIHPHPTLTETVMEAAEVFFGTGHARLQAEEEVTPRRPRAALGGCGLLGRMSRRLLISSALACLLLGPVACQASQSPSRPRRRPGRRPVWRRFVARPPRAWSCSSSPILPRALPAPASSPALKAIRDEFPNDVQIVFKHNPAPDDAKARLAHEAAVEAGRQGKFWEMHDLLFANQAKLGRDDLVGYAKTLGLDGAAFTRALDHVRTAPSSSATSLEARAIGAPTTPAHLHQRPARATACRRRRRSRPHSAAC